MLGFKDLFKKPSALRIAALELEQAMSDRLAMTKQREYHAAMEQMLMARISRLRHDVTELSKEQP